MISQSEIPLVLPTDDNEAVDCDFDQEKTEISPIFPKARERNPDKKVEVREKLSHRIQKILLYWLPPCVFLLPALACIAVEIYNRRYRGMSTPYLYVAGALFCFGLFFLIRKKIWMIPLAALTLLYLGMLAALQPWTGLDRSTQVYYYRQWWVDSTNGRIHLEQALGLYPPASGSYITCNFAVKSWLGYLDNQPTLCSAFDSKLRLSMFLHDHETDEGILREFQMNSFKVGRNSLLGEPLDRSALRIAFTEVPGTFFKKFQKREIYEVYEKNMGSEQSRIIESFSRNGSGKLRSFTESSLLNLTSKDVFALYNGQGLLKDIPKFGQKTFAFPAHIDISSVQDFSLDPRISNGEFPVDNQP